MKLAQSISFNGIRNDLDEETIIDLKLWYATYFRKSWCYNEMNKKLKRCKFVLNLGALIYGAGGVATVLATKGLALITISLIAVIIKSYSNVSNLDKKIMVTEVSYQICHSLSSELKAVLRGNHYNRLELVKKMEMIDEILSSSPLIPQSIKNKYSRIFID